MSDLLPIDETKLTTDKKNFEEALKAHEAIPGDTLELEMWWAARLEQAVSIEKTILEDKELVKRPVLEDAKKIDKKFEPALKPCRAYIALCRRKLAEAAQRRLEADADAHRLLLAADSAEAAMEALEAIPDAQKPRGIVDTWQYAIESVELEKVPLSWLRLDEEAVLKYAAQCKKDGKEPYVAGVAFVKKAAIRRTGK